MNITFEKMTKERMDVILEIINTNPVYNEFEMGEQLRTEEQMEEEFFNDFTQSYFIKLDDTYVGLVDYMENSEDKSMWIGIFMIHQDYQGFGIGTNAYYALEQQLKGGNYQKIRLVIGEGYECGIRFWEGVGFQHFEPYMVEERMMIGLEKRIE